MLKRFSVNWAYEKEVPDPNGWAVYADDAMLIIAELEAYIEDRERTINNLNTLVSGKHRLMLKYLERNTLLEVRLCECEATITRLDEENDSLQATNEQLLKNVAWCADCNMPEEHCRCYTAI